MSVRPKRDRLALGAEVRAAVAKRFRAQAEAWYPLIAAGHTPESLKATPVDTLDPKRWLRRAFALERGEAIWLQGFEFPHGPWRPPADVQSADFLLDEDGTVTQLCEPYSTERPWRAYTSPSDAGAP